MLSNLKSFNILTEKVEKLSTNCLISPVP